MSYIFEGSKGFEFSRIYDNGIKITQIWNILDKF